MWQIIDTYLGIVIMTLGVFIFDKIVLDEKIKISKINLIKYIFIASTIHTIAYFSLTGTIKTVIMCIINTLLCAYSFGLTTFKAFLTTFIYMVMLIIPDTIEMLLFTEIFGIEKSYYYNEFAGTALCNLIVCLLFLIMTILLRNKLNKVVNINIKNEKMINIYIVLTFLCIALCFYNSFENLIINKELIVSVFIMIVLTVVLLSLIKQKLDNNRLTNEYDKLLEFMTTYESEIENQRILRHEIKNEFRTIRAKISDKQNNKEIIEYIDEILNDKYEINKEKYAKFGYLPPNGIKGLFYFKTQEAENKGIKVSINISKKLKNSTIYNLSLKLQRDFGRIIGVFLDNAIEASVETKEKQIGIEVYVNDEGEVKLIISNTYNNQIDKTKLGIETFSTKGKTRGHGLLLVKQLVNKNDAFDIKTDIQNNIYIQTLEIKKIIED